jgi:hypothetical protein
MWGSEFTTKAYTQLGIRRKSCQLLCSGPLLSCYRARFWFTRCLIVVPRPLPAAALVARRRELIGVPRQLLAAALVVRRKYLIVVPRPIPAAPLIVSSRYLIVAPRPLPAAPRRCRSGRRETIQIRSVADYILPA